MNLFGDFSPLCARATYILSTNATSMQKPHELLYSCSDASVVAMLGYQ